MSLATKEQFIIAVVGLTGSGKSEAAERFKIQGFERVGFNDVIYEELSRRGLERNEENEKPVREELRKEFGAAVTAERSLPKIETAWAQGKNVVVESLYSWSEYKFLKERFSSQFRVLAIYAPPHIRYERLSQRPVRPHPPEEARSRDWAEIENIEKAGPIAMADWTIKNIGAKEEFLREVDLLVSGILGEN